MNVIIPVRTWSEANESVFYHKKADRTKKQRMGTMIMVRTSIPWRDLLADYPKIRIKLIRIAPRELDDDNLRSSLKHIRDGVADVFEMDDRDPRLIWEYGQERARKARDYSVRLEIEGRMS